MKEHTSSAHRQQVRRQQVRPNRFASLSVAIRFPALLLLTSTASLFASPPSVQFDLASLVACHDVTTEDFVRANPGERLLRATLEISTLLDQPVVDRTGIDQSGIDQPAANEMEYFIRVVSPGRQLMVADYQPKTTLASEYAGNINVEKRTESSKSAGVTISGVWNHLIKIAGSGDVGSKDNLAVRYELRAPMAPVTASGTILRGGGVYFKLRPSRQTALEGSRSFVLVFRAPSGWRGDYLQVHCEGNGVRRGVVRSLDEPFRCGSRDFFVGLYLAGDNEAKRRAARMVRAEQALQESLVRHRKRLAEDPQVSLVDQLSTIWKPQPSSPTHSQQIERLLFSPSNASLLGKVPAGLPGGLETALRNYLVARVHLRGLAGPLPGA